MYDLIVRDGLVVTPNGLHRADVAVREGRIATVASDIPASGAEEVTATGFHVLPGAVDAHVHLGVQNAGTWSCDDHATGTLAAVCGGVTTVGDFTIQDPGEGLMASIERRVALGVGRTWCDWFLHANVTFVSEAVLDEIPKAVAWGVGSFKVFFAYPGMRLPPETVREVLRRVGTSGGLLMAHCEDQDEVDRAVGVRVAKGLVAARHYFASRPAEAEARAIAVLGRIAQEEVQPAYVVHLSSLAGLQAARLARRNGAVLYVETCPQYLFLGRLSAPPRHPEHLVCAPPLRGRRDRQALLRALVRGEIEVLATDHCPFTSAQKAVGAMDFRRIPGGLPGVETLLPLAYDLALRGALPWHRLAEVIAQAPARLFGLGDRKGAVREGLDADLVVADPQAETVIHAGHLHSATDYNPYEGRRLRGALKAVYLRGRLVAERRPDGSLAPVVTHPVGQFVRAVPRH